MARSFAYSCLITALMNVAVPAQTWTDISTALINRIGPQPQQPYGCSGIGVNRLTGDVLTGVLWLGLWKSRDKGQNWTELDNKFFTGTFNNAWSLQIDQNNPSRVAVFALDGTGCYSPDGIAWRKMTYQGRGWDFGSVDWSTPDAKVMLVPQHESGGIVFKTTDGGATWTQLSISVNATGGGSSANAMLGVIDSTTFICCSGNGILRSTDGGGSWTKASSINPLSHVPVQFKGAFYLGTSAGLLVSKDNGATWQIQGASVNVYQGPFFGADENTMVVVGSQGVYKSTNAGTAWARISALYPNSQFDPSWFGCYSWDPINNIVYACRMTFPAYEYQLPATGVVERRTLFVPSADLTIANSTIRSVYPFDCIELFSLSGQVLYKRATQATCSLTDPKFSRSPESRVIFRASSLQGETFQAVR